MKRMLLIAMLLASVAAACGCSGPPKRRWFLGLSYEEARAERSVPTEGTERSVS